MSSESVEAKPLSRGTVIAARYEVEKYLGESLLGPTYVVKHIEQDSFLVLRFIRREYKSKDDFDLVQDLIQKIRDIRHPNMIRYGNVGIYQDTIFFTQEYFRSENLRALIINKQADMKEFSVEEAFSIATKILDAVEELHRVGIYHTTIKPENILVKDSAVGERFVRQIKLNDVMTATILGDKAVSSPYRAPECRPEFKKTIGKEASSASDIFSIGNVLYELLVGKPAKGTYLPPSQIRNNLSPAIDNIINTALSFQPEDRFASANLMSDNIHKNVGDFVVKSNEGMNKIALFSLSAAVLLLLAFIGYLKSTQGVGSDEEKQFDQTLKEDAQLLEEVTKNFERPNQEEMDKMNQKVEGMMYIPAGPAVIGIFQREYDYKLTKKISTDIPASVQSTGHFYIDRFEYPNELPAKGEKPKILDRVSFDEAAQLCIKQGKRLCTALEWEKACRGVNNYIYSYSDTYDAEYCNKENYAEKCKNAYGVYGMSSDAAEWVNTVSRTSSKRMIFKGGDIAGTPEKRYRCSNEVIKPKDYKNTLLSFRCCKDVEQVLFEEQERIRKEEEEKAAQEENADTAEESSEKEK